MTDRHAIDAAADVYVQMRYDNIVRGPKEHAAEIILAYLSALAADEESVEAVARAMCQSEEVPPDEVYATWEDGRMLQWETYQDAARAVLATLLSRAKEQKP